MIDCTVNTLIVGASLSGLACAACLRKRGIGYCIIEKSDVSASPWHRHYDRLHLHTPKWISHLPYKKFDPDIPRYPSRMQLIEYVDGYQKAFDIQPRFNTEALNILRVDDVWIARTNQGIFRSRNLIMATGAYGKPRPLRFTGIETFPGPALHSAQYKTGKIFKDQKVLVVGFGNSACEIALDLYEQGGIPSLSVRSAVNIVPRDVLGLPVLALSALLDPLPPRLADILIAPLMRWLVGDIADLGLRKLSYGPLEELRRNMNPPVLDIGTIGHIRKGRIRIFDDIDRISGNTIHFKDRRCEQFDAIVAGIGYYRVYDQLLSVDDRRFSDLGVPVSKQKYFGKDGLYFCGYWISPTGQIREISRDARAIARHITQHAAG